MSKMNSVSAKGFCGRALARTIAVFFLVTFAFAAALVFAASAAPQQALADSALQAGAIDETDSEGELTTQATSKFSSSMMNCLVQNRYLPIKLYDPNHTYCDGDVLIRIYWDRSIPTQEVGYWSGWDANFYYRYEPFFASVYGTSAGAKKLMVPETVHLDDATKEEILQGFTEMYQAWKNNNLPKIVESRESVEDLFSVWLVDGWDSEESYTPALKDLGDSIPVLSVYHEQDASYFWDGHDDYPTDTLQQLSFEESENSSSLNTLIVSLCSVTSFTQITLPSYRKYILDGSCFSNNESLESITVTSSLEGDIHSYVFSGCTSLSSVTLEPGITGIGFNSFSWCASLESIVFPDSVTTISNRAFDKCSELKNITWPNNDDFTTVDGFSNCVSLNSSVIDSLPASVTSIGQKPRCEELGEWTPMGAFSGCGFTSLTIPSQITNIGSYAFYGCEGLDESTIVIPYNVQSIGQMAFCVSKQEIQGTPKSLTVRFMNPGFMFTKCEPFPFSRDYEQMLISSEKLGTECDFYYHPFTNTQVHIEAPATYGSGMSPLKRAYESYYVREERSKNTTGTLFSERKLPDNSGRFEYSFSSDYFDTKHAVTGSVPSGAVVVVTGDGQPVEVTQSATSSGVAFASQVVEGKDVEVRVSLPGYHDRTFTKSGAEFTEDWEVCNLTVNDFTASSGNPAKGKMSVLNQKEVVFGTPFIVKVDYMLPSGAKSGTVTFDLPSGARLLSVSDEKSKLGVSSTSLNGLKAISVPVTQSSGALYIRLSLPSEGDYTLTGTILCDGVVGDLESCEVFCRGVLITQCPDIVGSTAGNKMRVTTAPTAVVTVKVGEDVVGGPTRASAAGMADVEFGLPDYAVTDHKYELTVISVFEPSLLESSVEEQGNELVVAESSVTSTATKTVEYKLLTGSVLSWTVAPSLRYSYNLVYAGETYPAKSCSYSYTTTLPTATELDANWLYAVELILDSPLSNDVRVEAYGRAGTVLQRVPLYIESQSVTGGGQYSYRLVGIGVEQNYLDALQRYYNDEWFVNKKGNVSVLIEDLPTTFVLTDDAGLYLETYLIPIIDPSGTVFEAVPSNVLSGVTATIRQANDALGTNSRDWAEAPQYDQTVEIVTDEDGFYAWDVPEGWWQVAFTLDGYLSAATKWMEVQPPRLGLQTGLVSTALPTVEAVYAYEDAIQIEFSQYMKTGSISGTDEYSAVSVAINDTTVSVDQLQWVDCEESLEGESLSRTLKVLAPENSPYSGTVSLSVSSAKNYAGNAMASAYTEDAVVQEQEPSLLLFANKVDTNVVGQYSSSVIEAAGLVGQASVLVGSNPGVPVSVTLIDTKGQPIERASLNVSITQGVGVKIAATDDAALAGDSASITTNDAGVATVYAFGITPGLAKLAIAVAGSPLTGEALVVAATAPTMYDVTFDTGDGSPVTPTQVAEGGTATEPDPNPTLSGYRFGYWYAGNDESDRYEFDTPVTSDLVLHAKWIKLCSVTASSTNDSVGTVKINDRDAATSDSVTVDEGSSVTLKAVPIDGYHFVSWSENDTVINGAGETYTVSNISADRSFVADFAPDFVAVTNITGVPTAGVAGTDLTLTGTVEPSTATNSAITWSLVSAGSTGVSLANGKLTGATAGGTVTVCATVVNGATASTNYTKNFTITLAAPPAPDQVVVSFETDGGTVIAPVTIDKGSTVARPASNPERTGYRFAYWYEGSNASTPYDFTAAINTSITLHAKWVKQWTIKASAGNSAGGKIKIAARNEAASDTLVVDEGASVSVVAIPSEGYHFSSWSLGGTPLLGSQATFTENNVTSDLVLVANFVQDEDPDNPGGDDPDNPGGGDNPVTTVTVSVVGGKDLPLVGGTVTGAGSYKVGDIVTLTAIPDQGFTFAGWRSEGDIELIPITDVLDVAAASILQVMAEETNDYLSTDETIRFQANSDVTIQAVFGAVYNDPEQGDDPNGGSGGNGGNSGSTNPEQGDDPNGGGNNSGTDPEQGDDPSKSDDPEKGTDSGKTNDSEQGKGSEQGSNTDTTDTTTKATSATTNTSVAAKGSAPATGDLALTFVINALSVLALAAALVIAFRRRA